MTHPTQPIDFNSLHRYTETRLDALHDYDEIYFLGDYTTCFSMRAPAIAAALPNFAGIAVFSVSPEKRVRISQKLRVKQNWHFIEISDLVARAASKRVLIIDFNDSLAGKAIGYKLAEQGLTVRDCIFAMHQLKLVHTYLPVNEERDYIAANLDRFIAVADRFGDHLSRRTLFARLQAVLTLDRRPLIEVSIPFADYLNNHSTKAGLVVGDDDIFIDAGAAHGDTVSQFVQLTGGKYRAIHSFEPDATNFFSLQKLCSYLPNTHVYQAGLGEKTAEVDFYECPENRLGGNFTGVGARSRVKTTMQVMSIDETVEEATLIKADVEGWEAQVLKGGARLISRHKPNITISAYHYPKDIPELVATLDEIAPYKNVALRHHSPWLYDTQLVFSDRQNFS